jgi:hypothetical protein
MNKSEELDIDGRIILKLILRNYSARTWLGFIRFRIGTGVGNL